MRTSLAVFLLAAIAALMRKTNYSATSSMLAFSALAALLLCATSVRAQDAFLQIDPLLSSLTFSEQTNLSFYGLTGDGSGGPGTYSSTVQLGNVGSNTTSVSGIIHVGLAPGSIQFLPDSSGMVLGNNGSWYPGETLSGQPGDPLPLGGTTGSQVGNIGLQFTGLSELVRISGVEMNFLPFNSDSAIGLTGTGNAPMTLSGNSFSLAGQSLVDTQGIQDAYGPLFQGVQTHLNSGINPGNAYGFTGLPMPLVAGTGTWNPITGQLVVPIISQITIPSNTPTTFTITGQIVANVIAPEPSTFVLGIAGLAGLGFATLRKKFRRD
jgi:hypothetical protein